MTKPKGINCAKKLKAIRVKGKWADKDYRKRHLGVRIKADPFGGASHAKGIVLEKM